MWEFRPMRCRWGGAKQNNTTYFDGQFNTIKIICAINEAPVFTTCKKKIYIYI